MLLTAVFRSGTHSIRVALGVMLALHHTAEFTSAQSTEAHLFLTSSGGRSNCMGTALAPEDCSRHSRGVKLTLQSPDLCFAARVPPAPNAGLYSVNAA